MKKFLTAFLLTCACALTGAAIACNDTPSDSSSSLTQESSSSTGNSSVDSSVVLGEERSVSFTEGEGYRFISNAENGKLRENETLTFTVDAGAFYTTENMIAYVNGKPIAPKADGSYEVPVGSENIAVRVEGIQKDKPNVTGSGAIDDAFVVRKPIDLIFIAEKVNSGDTKYSRGAYVLANDIDCKGEELKIIGDLSTDQAFFGGSFSCESDPNTGVVTRHKISNFVINSTSSNNVGLFGAVQADMTVESSGLFYGIILENFTINVSTANIADDNKTTFVGGLMGYGAGATMFLCDAINGEININADINYFTFAGGLVGYQQGVYNEMYDSSYPFEITYSVVDVDINAVSGLTLYAGGISGFISTNAPYGATASVHNSYSTGSISGALRSGGIVGGMDQYTVVSNCYATSGEFGINAISSQNVKDLLGKDAKDDYCYAYAGGIVGYAENDSISHDCFFNGTVSAYAVSGSKYERENGIIGAGPEAGDRSVDSKKYLAYNCWISTTDSAPSDFASLLGWGKHDWIFSEDKLPVINYEAPEKAVVLELTLNYVNPKTETSVSIGGKTSQTYTIFNSTKSSGYSPFGNFIANGSLPVYQAADESNYRSFGYFFDEDCTKPVPNSYLPTKSVTLYVGFADVTPVVGTYYLNVDGERLHITLNENGVVTYSDGATEQTANFAFDGTTVILENVRLARYYYGEVIEGDPLDTTVFSDPLFDLNRYNFYNFKGTLTNEGMSFYDGNYFTKENPLTATKTEPITPNRDAFTGTWTKSATLHKTYVFDGAGKWTYTYTDYERALSQGKIVVNAHPVSESGNYTVDGEYLLFTQGGVDYTAYVNGDGVLEITANGVTQLYYAEHSYVGTWQCANFELALSGLGNGYGYATLTEDIDGLTYVNNLIYEAVKGDGATVLTFYTYTDSSVKDLLYGYATYDLAQNTLRFVRADNDSENGYSEQSLYVYDDYYGEWVTNFDSLSNVEISFDGLGLYPYLNKNGTLTLTDEKETLTVSYTLDANLAGKFSYKGNTYEMTYDDVAKQINIVVVNVDNTTFERKDELAGIKFVDLNGKTYVFDGRSTLDSNGTLTTSDNERYTYVADGDGFKILLGTEEKGSLIKSDLYYLLRLNEQSIPLYIDNKFRGDWAINGQYALFKIGPTDLNGVIKANFKGTDVEMSIIDPTMLTFSYEENKMPITYYVFVIYDETTGNDVLLFSEFTNPFMGEYFICSKMNELFGSWQLKRDNGRTTLTFDGVTSGFVSGTAELTVKLDFKTITTHYNYLVREKGTFMWSRDLLAGRTTYFSLDLVDEKDYETALKEDNVFVLYDGEGNISKVLRKTPVDGLYTTEAIDENGAKYFFDGKGNLYVDNQLKYTYLVTSYNSDDTATLKVTDTETNVTYWATLDYSDSEKDNVFILGDVVKAEETPQE